MKICNMVENFYNDEKSNKNFEFSLDEEKFTRLWLIIFLEEN